MALSRALFTITIYLTDTTLIFLKSGLYKNKNLVLRIIEVIINLSYFYLIQLRLTIRERVNRMNQDFFIISVKIPMTMTFMV